jgi:hypothetical protein
VDRFAEVEARLLAFGEKECGRQPDQGVDILLKRSPLEQSRDAQPAPEGAVYLPFRPLPPTPARRRCEWTP